MLESETENPDNMFARKLAVKPVLAEYPGWHFGIGLVPYFTRFSSPAKKLRMRIFSNLKEPFYINWLSGIRVMIYPKDELCREIYLCGMNEPNEFVFVDRVLKPGMTFLDVGANMGLFTLFASTKVGNGGRVVSVEPSSREFSKLETNCKINKLTNVSLVKKAASDHQGSAVLKIAVDEHAGHNTLGSFPGVTTSLLSEETVVLDTIDSIISALKLNNVHMIKIDVEGAEEKVLRGAKETISRFHPLLLFEFSDNTLTLQGSSTARILDYFRTIDYSVFTFTSGAKVVPMSSVNNPSANLVAAPRASEWAGVFERNASV